MTGGFDLASQWMGWENKFHCEIEPFGQRILKYYWPKAKSYEDITKTNFSIWREKIDILTGGFPCQPYSQAGKRLGKEDSRHLWPEMLRAIREIKPTWVVGENVYGLVNWSGGLVFEEVQTDLEKEGYEVQPVILPAASVNAPHKRDRIWFIAIDTNSSTNKSPQNMGGKNGGRFSKTEQERVFQKTHNKFIRFNNISLRKRIVTNSDSIRLQRQRWPKRQINSKEGRNWEKYRVVDDGRWPIESPILGRNDGFPKRLDIDTISRKDWIEETSKGFGNAIVPQVAYQIFKAIEQTTLF